MDVGLKKFVIKEATKKRCHIFDVDANTCKEFRIISLELYPYLLEVEKIDFSFYFRNSDQMIEFIRPHELSKSLIHQMWAATQVISADVDVCIKRSEYRKFEAIIDKVRADKIQQVMEMDPTLDPTVLTIFNDLSSASQMVVKGGVDATTAQRAEKVIAAMMQNLVDSEIVIGTLRRMIHCDATLYDHSASVAMLSGIIGKQLEKPMSRKEAEIVAKCGLYHDMGKTCIPTSVLNKPGKFTKEEFEIMKLHTVLGKEELEAVIKNGAPLEKVISQVAEEHHERFKGGGYPHGKKGRLEEDGQDGIHLYSRIVSIADVYAALLQKRVYKEAYTQEQALDVLQDIAEDGFDPVIYNRFHNHVLKSIKRYKIKEEKARKSNIQMIDDKASFAKAIRARGGR